MIITENANFTTGNIQGHGAMCWGYLQERRSACLLQGAVVVGVIEIRLLIRSRSSQFAPPNWVTLALSSL